MTVPDNPGYLQSVAKVYLEALDLPDPTPMRAVATYLGRSRATAGRYIRQARDAGLIPPRVDGEGLRRVPYCPTCGAPRSRWGKTGR